MLEAFSFLLVNLYLFPHVLGDRALPVQRGEGLALLRSGQGHLPEPDEHQQSRAQGQSTVHPWLRVRQELPPQRVRPESTRLVSGSGQSIG
jgi:hypothetical protein